MTTTGLAAAGLEPRYTLSDVNEVETPAIAVVLSMARENIARTLAMLPDPRQLRPHAKTHKTIELTRMQIEAGVMAHKCATIAEAEVLARAGAPDIVIAYPIVGPNIERLLRLAARYPSCSIKPLADHPAPIEALQLAAKRAGTTVEVLIDLDVGMGRTGIAVDKAAALYRQLGQQPNLRPGGLHAYDGHNNQKDAVAREQLVQTIWSSVRQLADELTRDGLPVPRIVAGGSPSFPAWSRIAREDARIECSPGTFFLNDAGYHGNYADLPFPPAIVLLTRVVSKPRPDRLTLDLGTKACASDPPIDRRVRLLSIPDGKVAGQNEEHLIVETPSADQYQPGDLVYAHPYHVCPTCALHREILVIDDNRVVDRWPVLARDRHLAC